MSEIVSIPFLLKTHHVQHLPFGNATDMENSDRQKIIEHEIVPPLSMKMSSTPEIDAFERRNSELLSKEYLKIQKEAEFLERRSHRNSNDEESQNSETREKLEAQLKKRDFVKNMTWVLFCGSMGNYFLRSK